MLRSRKWECATQEMSVLSMTPAEDSSTLNLLQRAVGGDREAWNEALMLHRERLKRMIRLRINPRLQARVDESDIVQDVFLDATTRLPDYVSNPSVPFYLWLRKIAGHKLIDIHRRHLGADKRAVSLEVSLNSGRYPTASSASLAAQLMGRLSSPSQGVMREELRIRVEEALNALDPLDREVLALRHYEQLSNTEVAAVLDLSASTASSRYLRALKKIKDILSGGQGLSPAAL